MATNYLRVFSTFIPRLVWPTKPLFGRDPWISAWMAGSETRARRGLYGPAIGILGATQLTAAPGNGDRPGLCRILLLRVAYEYFRLHAHVPWAQFWWAITFFNAWFMVVSDDP